MYPTFVKKPFKKHFLITSQYRSPEPDAHSPKLLFWGRRTETAAPGSTREKAVVSYLSHFYYLTESIILAALQKLLSSDQWTHQEAHKVEDKDSRHSAERQALQHWAANLGRVTVVLGQDCGCWSDAALRWGAPSDPSDGHYEHKYSVTLNSRFITCRNNTYADYYF